MARVVAKCVFVGSALPVVVDVLWVQYFVLLLLWLQLSIFVLSLLSRILYQILQQIILQPLGCRINHVLLIIKLYKRRYSQPIQELINSLAVAKESSPIIHSPEQALYFIQLKPSNNSELPLLTVLVQ